MLAVGLVIIIVAKPVPLITDHSPVPLTGALPVSVAEVARHRSWSGPAFAGVAPATMVIVSSEKLTQLELVIVHLNI